MNLLKDIAYQILKEASKALHSKEIVKFCFLEGDLKLPEKHPK